ncbi:MAG: cupin domain-containing protein, partial [Solobacterium sp.]|nr:cupin domain-containing protein [Solobacterium sp.]
MKITILSPDGEVSHVYLGKDVGKGQRAMAIVPKCSIFSAVNLDDSGYSFVSCVTAPKFSYEGFRLVPEDEIRQRTGMQCRE